jgi:hypothetical protein
MIDPAKLVELGRKLDDLLLDEDLTDEKLREASGGLLPNIADAIAGRGRYRALMDEQQLSAGRQPEYIYCPKCNEPMRCTDEKRDDWYCRRCEEKWVNGSIRDRQPTRVDEQRPIEEKLERCPSCNSIHRQEKLISYTQIHGHPCRDRWHEQPILSAPMVGESEPQQQPANDFQKWELCRHDILQKDCAECREQQPAPEPSPTDPIAAVLSPSAWQPPQEWKPKVGDKFTCAKCDMCNDHHGEHIAKKIRLGRVTDETGWEHNATDCRLVPPPVEKPLTLSQELYQAIMEEEEEKPFQGPHWRRELRVAVPQNPHDQAIEDLFDRVHDLRRELKRLEGEVRK